MRSKGTTSRPTKNPFARRYSYSECESARPVNKDNGAVNKDSTGKSKAQKTAKNSQSESANSGEKTHSSPQFKNERGPYNVQKPAENWEISVVKSAVNKDPMGDTPIVFTFTDQDAELRLATDAIFGSGSSIHYVPSPLPRLYDAARQIAMSDTRMKETGNPACVISLDTEYVGLEDGTNELVSLQMTIAHCSGLLVQVLIMPTQRPKFGALVDWAYHFMGFTGRVNDCVVVLAHFWAAEWSVLADREDIARYVTDVRRTPVTIGPGIMVKTFDNNRHPRIFRVLMRDTVLLSPAGSGSLSAWGDILGFEKLKLSYDEITNMDKLAQNDFDKFSAYAIRDTEVCLLAYSEVQSWCDTMSHVDGFRMGLTLGSTSVNLFTSLAGGRACIYESFGNVKQSYVDEKGRKKSRYMPCEARVSGDPLASECFHGGFNQARYFGHLEAPDGWRVYDVDLAGAYASAMACIPAIDYSCLPVSSTDLVQIMSLYQQGHLVVAHASFSFPPDTLDPCLPVSTSRGLQYPLEGVTYCTGPELALALNMGARIELHKAEAWTPIPGKFMFVDYLSGMMKERGKYPKKSLKNALFKEMVNSLYGKVAQGIKKRNVTNFSAFGGVVKEVLGESAVTLPIAAATITGIIRASLFEMNHAFSKAYCKVITSTTDGSMVLAPVGTDFNQIVRETEAFNTLMNGRRRLGIAQADVVLELKAEGVACDSRRTRANAIYDEKGNTIHIAQGGIKVEVPYDLSSEERKSYIGLKLRELDNDLFVRHAERRSLVSAKKVSHGHAEDLVTEVGSIRVHNDYDFKRRLTDSGWSLPWKTLKEIENALSCADALHKIDKRASFEIMELAIRGIRVTDVADTYARAVRRAIAKGVNGWLECAVDHPAFHMTKQQKYADKKRPLIKLPRNKYTLAYVTVCAELLTTDKSAIQKMVDTVLEGETFVSPDTESFDIGYTGVVKGLLSPVSKRRSVSEVLCADIGNVAYRPLSDLLNGVLAGIVTDDVERRHTGFKQPH